jgi:ElaA protein
MAIITHIKKFHELTLDELYAVLALRNLVFVVEQQSIYNDTDGLDQNSLHLLVKDDVDLIGYVRILPPKLKFGEAAFGRLVVAQNVREKGLGKKLLSEVIQHIKTVFPAATIRIEAQAYLKAWYEKFGFKQAGEIYDLDGIPHIEMVKPKS